MKRSEWQRAYDPDPVRLEARVRHTLANLDAAPAARPRALRTALIAALVLALLGGIALAVYESRTARPWRGGSAARRERTNCFRATSRPRARAHGWAM